MYFMKKNKAYVLTVVVILIALFYFSINIGKTYGNDKESIEKVIQSIKGYENKSIDILEIKDIYDQRLVAFLSNNNPAYIQFSNNEKGNYEWNHIEKSQDQSFAKYLIHVPNKETVLLKYMLVTSQENNIAKMELDVNGQVIEQEFRVHQNSVSWIDLPKDKALAFKYQYFDKDGNVIGYH